MTNQNNNTYFCEMGFSGTDGLKSELQKIIPSLISVRRPSVQATSQMANDGEEPHRAKDKFIVMMNNPIVRNLRFFSSLKSDRPASTSDEEYIDQFTNSVHIRSAQHWFSKEILQFLGANYNEFKKPQPGVIFTPGRMGEILILAAELPHASLSKFISDFLGVDFKPRSIANWSPEDDSVLFRRISNIGLPTSYVSEILSLPFVRHLYDKKQIFDMRISWENSGPARRLRKDVKLEEFGNEIPSQIPGASPGMRMYEAEGAFLHKAGRKNIAISKFWSANASHPEDLWGLENLETLKKANYEHWKNDNSPGITGVAFRPKVDVAVHNISIEVVDLPIEKYPFLLGDGCVYFDEATSPKRGRRIFPGPAEAHCTAISLKNSSSFTRSVGFPEDLPLYVSRDEYISTPQHFARHWPHEIDEEDLESARVKVRISYMPHNRSRRVHKFIRIPYLDQYPKSPVMIQEDRPWYKAWDESEPLVVRGFSVYFSPKPPIPQHLESLKLLVLDRDGIPVPGKELSMEDQVAGNGNESFSLDPSFVRGDLIVEDGEYLSARGYLIDGTPSADMAFYVLVEIPESRIEDSYGNPLYYSRGCVNLNYLHNEYNRDRIAFNSTPAALSILDYVSQTRLSPWFEDLAGKFDVTNNDEKQEMRSVAARYIFVD